MAMVTIAGATSHTHPPARRAAVAAAPALPSSRARSCRYRGDMQPVVAAPPMGRRQAALLAGGALAGCALLAVADPDDGGPYPTCPTRALLGVDCPACGTLRGVHAALRGRLVEALDHNLLLLVALPVVGVVWLGWLAQAIGATAPLRRLPRWAVPAGVALAIVFGIARNLPGDRLGWLASSA